MDPINRRTKPLEATISGLLLAILLFIGLAVFAKQFKYDMSRFGIEQPPADYPSRQPQTVPNHELDLASLGPENFQALSKTEVYDPHNLYEKIDGKASLYLDSGFTKLLTQRFISKDDENLWAELFVYDMAAPKNAFSVYTIQRRVDAVPLGTADPNYAYRTANALYFVNGPYYIELVGSAESQPLLAAMVKISDNLRKKLPVNNLTDIADSTLFPPENIVTGSIKLYLTNAFGFQDLTDTFTARYKLTDETVTAFISRQPDSIKAATVAQSYYNFLIENGGTAKQASNEIFHGRIIDFYDTTEIIVPAGPFVAGVHEAQNQNSAEDLALMLLNRLNEAAKAKTDDRAKRQTVR